MFHHAYRCIFHWHLNPMRPESMPRQSQSAGSLAAGNTCVASRRPHTDREDIFPLSGFSYLSPQPQKQKPVSLPCPISLCLMKGLAHPGTNIFGGSTLLGLSWDLSSCYKKLSPTLNLSCNSSSCFPAHLALSQLLSGSGLLKGQSL